MKEIPKSYEPRQYEDAISRLWEASGLTNPDNLSGEPYAIMMPPPNVTGVLHLGHALENSLMDTMARYQRMRGKNVLLLPGTDHAAVATQAKVERLLVEQGIANPRQELGRQALVEKIRVYAEESKATILSQVKKMGTSADWSRLAYTFDDERNRAVNEIFVRMYNDGLIYRGTRLVNWSVGAQSVLSDDELEWEDRSEPFYYIRCGKFVIGTVRPETKCADSPLVVHPEGEYVTLAFTNAAGEPDELIVAKQLFENREEFDRIFNVLNAKSDFTVTNTQTGKELEGIEFDYPTYAAVRHFSVLADEVIDMEKGAGAMTISTCHSADDYDLANRRELADTFVVKIDFSGKMTDIAGPLTGEPIESARKKSVEMMREQGLIVGVDENYVHRVPLCYRTKTVIEPMVSKQWFLDVNKPFTLRASKLQNIQAGDEVTLKMLMQSVVRSGEVKILPDRFEHTYFNWIDNLRDWCISRQIWWGHRIPVWYKDDAEYCGTAAPEGEGWVQDEDSLDTWFSSGLWTFSTLGWPDETEDLKNFHPTAWMQMGYEILFFWMARMILMSTYALGEIPFSNVYIHGILRDKNGKKFSKSAGNGIDPLDVIAEYGTDALRLSLLSGISPGNDARFYTEKVEGSQHLVNKLWNMCRFMLMQIESPMRECAEPIPASAADQWILWKLDQVVAATIADFEAYQFSAASERLRDFTWNDLADWYLEMAKIEGNKSSMLNYILNTVLKLWHPYLPFVTEALWHQVYDESALLMGEKYPQPSAIPLNHTIGFVDETLRGVISGLRTLRSERGAAPSKKLSATIVAAGDAQTGLEQSAALIRGLAGLESLTVTDKHEKSPTETSHALAAGIELYLDLAGAVDTEAERARLEKEIAHVAPYVAAQEKKLAGPFATQAPAPVVEQERQKLADAKEKLEKLQFQLSSL